MPFQCPKCSAYTPGRENWKPGEMIGAPGGLLGSEPHPDMKIDKCIVITSHVLEEGSHPESGQFEPRDVKCTGCGFTGLAFEDFWIDERDFEPFNQED